MGNNQNSFFDTINRTFLNINWFKDLYKKNEQEQKNTIKQVFTVNYDNDINHAEKKHLENKTESLQEKVERLEAKMAVLAEELSKNEKEISIASKRVTELVTAAKTKSEEMEKVEKEYVEDCIEDVFYEYQQGIVGKDEISGEIAKRIRGGKKGERIARNIDKILLELGGKQSELSSLINNATKWMDQRTILSQQYGATKSAYDLLKTSMDKIGATNTNYTNHDINTQIPVYSPKQLGLISDVKENHTVKSGRNTDYKKGSKQPTVEEVSEKYKDYLKVPATEGVDKACYDNLTLQNLDKALQDGLIGDLTSIGLNQKEISDFIVENFEGANIHYLPDGSLHIPFGHESADGKMKSQDVYNKLINDLKVYNTSFLGTKNTWDKNHGNTIDSNKQIKELGENFNTILEDFANSSPKLTFKEAMYALFDPKIGVFKDSGVIYDTKKQGEMPNYYIEFAGDVQTANMYKDLSDKIFEIWGVKPSRGLDYSQENLDEVKPPETNENQDITRTDPIWFNINENSNEKYSFVIDRNKDGSFDSNKDFVGGDKNSTWLDDLRSLDKNNDGKLTGEELDELKVLGTNYRDSISAENYESNLEYNPEKKESNKTYKRGQDTDIEYSIKSASSMGIEEIDLSDLDKQVNKTTNKVDMNNSELFEDSFSFKINGEEITARRQDETEDFMNVVYKDAYDKNYNIKMSDTEAEEIISKDYKEFHKFDEKYTNLYTDINVVRGTNSLAQESSSLYEEAKNRIQANQTIETIKAGNRAAALTNLTGWANVQAQIAQIAAEENIEIDMDQAKGIYVLDKSLDARGVVDKYKEQALMEKNVKEDRENSRIAWDAIIQCARAGLDFNAKEIMNMLKEGKAQNSDEIVELLKQAQDKGINTNLVIKDLGFDSDREKEIYEAFNEVFNDLNLNDKVVEALAILCQKQLDNPKYMSDKSAEELAKEILKEFQD